MLILLFDQTSIKATNNTIDAQIVISSVNFVHPRSLRFVWGNLPGDKIRADMS